MIDLHDFFERGNFRLNCGKRSVVLFGKYICEKSIKFFIEVNSGN